MLHRAIYAALRRPLATLLVFATLGAFGFFAWRTKAIDALPDLTPPQVLVELAWPGAAPAELEQGLARELARRLRALPEVAEVRGMSGYGHGALHVELVDAPFLLPGAARARLARARELVREELLAASRAFPAGASAALGPAATAMGQVLWYTVEGPLDLGALRVLQDEVVKPALEEVAGVAEVASCGGFVPEIEIVLDPERLAFFGLAASEVARALESALRVDVGSAGVERDGLELRLRTLPPVLELTAVEELPIARLPAPLDPARLGAAPVRVEGEGVPSSAFGITPNVRMNAGGGGHGGPEMALGMGAPETHASGAPRAPVGEPSGAAGTLPLRVRDVGSVALAAAPRAGALADERGELVGGAVALRDGANAREVLRAIEQRLRALNDPAQRALPEGVFVAPFYDRSALIEETVATLERALAQELALTLLVTALFLFHVKSALLVAVTLPISVLLAFLAMRLLGIDANLTSLTGIAIAIGTMVDLGIVMTESCHRALVEARAGRSARACLERAVREVARPLATASATTVLCFLPLLLLEQEEGRLFRPLVWTKTLALGAATLTGLFLVPVLCLRGLPERARTGSRAERIGFALAALFAGALLAACLPNGDARLLAFPLAALVAWLLLRHLAAERLRSIDENPLARAIARTYAALLAAALRRKALFLALPAALLFLGLLAGLGAARCRAPLRALFGPAVDRSALAGWLDERFPGLGREFLPPLDEGALLYMPSLLPGASLAQTVEVMRAQNERFAAIPEVARVVGKAGRAESALDPAPIGMIETVLALRARADWRAGLTREALAEEVLRAARTIGVSGGRGALLQPIETRIVMLSSGVRTSLALRLRGTPRDAAGRQLEPHAAAEELERCARRVREALRGVAGVRDPSVESSGALGITELEVDPARLAEHGIAFAELCEALRLGFDGVATPLEPAVRASDGARALRVRVDAADAHPAERCAALLLRSAEGRLVRLGELARAVEREGPAMIETLDGELRQHVGFAADGIDEASAMERALAAIGTWRAAERAAGRSDPLPSGVALESAGRYEAELRSRTRLAWVAPLCAVLVFAFVALGLRSFALALCVFTAVPVTAAGGVLLLAVFPALQDGLHALGLLDAPSAGPLHLTVAVAVGFVALFGLATDDGVLIGAHLQQRFAERRFTSRDEIRAAVLDAGLRRVRPCLMTSVTTIAGLLPVLVTGARGAELALPMAVPLVGGMCAELLSMFVVPVLYAWHAERRFARGEAVGGV